MGDPWNITPTAPTRANPKDIQRLKAFLAKAVNAAQLAAALLPFVEPPAFADKPARDLTDQQAFELLLHLFAKGEVFIEEPFRFDKTGKIIHPRPGEQLKLRTHMAGVDFYRAGLKTGFAGAVQQPVFQPSPAFAIVLHRLAVRLGGGYYGATRIVWGGIGHGHDGKALNCHMTGTCVDFYGAHTRHGKFDVLADWGKKPVFKPDGTRRPVPPGSYDAWGGSHATYYRLRASDPGLAYYFFQEVYGLAYEQCTVGGSDVAALKEGQAVQAGTIIHPDYPQPGLRGSHQEHMHFQLGAAYL